MDVGKVILLLIPQRQSCFCGADSPWRLSQILHSYCFMCRDETL